MPRKRIKLAQNFFRNERLVADIVANSSISKKDIVYEIGPGEGIITKYLARKAEFVIAIEKDSYFSSHLKKKFNNFHNIKIVKGDFLAFHIKHKRYKIFANIPFNITAKIIKRILFGKNHPSEAYLVVQKEAAEKFAGIPYETEVSILAKPFFDLQILRKFKREDFEPIPSVDVVLLYIKKLSKPLISFQEKEIYEKFIKYAFKSRKSNLKLTYKHIFTYNQWKRLSKDLKFPVDATPTQLAFHQWVGLFKYFLIGVAENKKLYLLDH